MNHATQTNPFQLIRLRLTWAWSLVAFAFVALAYFDLMPAFSMATQLAILAVAVALIGLPHGALDHFVARDVLQARFPKTWIVIFSAVYLGLAALVMFGWWLAASVTLILFLVASVIHFGMGDVSDVSGDSGVSHARYPDSLGPLSWFEALLMGAIPIVVPCIFFPDQVSFLFGWLTNSPADQWRWSPPLSSLSSTVASWLWYVVIVFLAVVLPVVVSLAVVRVRRGTAMRGSPAAEARVAHSKFFIEVSATVCLFIFLPPLIAFTWYFCGLHSPRHLLTLAERLPITQVQPLSQTPRWASQTPWLAIGRVLIHSLPLSIITIIGAALAYWWLRGHDQQSALARVIFWGLAALTFPHMLFTGLWDGVWKFGLPSKQL